LLLSQQIPIAKNAARALSAINSSEGDSTRPFRVALLTDEFWNNPLVNAKWHTRAHTLSLFNDVNLIYAAVGYLHPPFILLLIY
jgi:hypothetical protein